MDLHGKGKIMGINLENQDEKDNRKELNDPYGQYIPAEIPIPDIERARQDDPYRSRDPEHPYGKNSAWQAGKADPVYGAQGQQYLPQQQKKGVSVKILIAVVSVVIVIFTIVGIGTAYFRSTAAYKLGKGAQNLAKEFVQIQDPLMDKLGLEALALMMAEDGSHIDTTINFTAESLYGTTIGVDTESYKDVPNKQMSANTSVSVMNYEFAHLNLYADEESFCFSIPELFIEDMYIDNENVISQYNQSFLAEVLGISDAEDFSIDLFADMDDRMSIREWKDLDAFAERYEEDFQACREKMVMEKAGKGFYRIVFPAREMDRLLQDLTKTYDQIYEMAGEEQWWKEYDRLIDSDISVLFEISKSNRIESISLETPVAMLDGTASMEASLHFLGDQRSIDRIQGEISVQGEDDIERAIHYQIVQTARENTYKLDMDVELMEENDSVLRVKYVTNSDADKDDFDMNFSVWDDEEDMELILEGNLDDIVKGRSLLLDLERITFRMDGEELFKITGEILVEPLEDEVTGNVEKKTAFFDMTEDDWLDILYEIDDAYGGFLNYLW